MERQQAYVRREQLNRRITLWQLRRLIKEEVDMAGSSGRCQKRREKNNDTEKDNAGNVGTLELSKDKILVDV